MEAQEKQYQDGVNSGYFLAQHEPELAAIIQDAARPAQTRSEYAAGLSIGHDLYILEQGGVEMRKDAIANNTPAQSPESTYIKGFNSGYLLSRYEPELARLFITQQKDPNDYHKGLSAGKQQRDTEVKEWVNQFTKGNQTRDDREPDKER